MNPLTLDVKTGRTPFISIDRRRISSNRLADAGGLKWQRSNLIPLCTLIALLAVVAGCANRPTEVQPPPGPLADCQMRFAHANASIEKAGVRDQGTALIADYPYLRTNRFLASFSQQLGTEAQRQAWIGHLSRLDTEARALEMRNLETAGASPDTPQRYARLDHCRDLLVANLKQHPDQMKRLQERTKVPDDYLIGWRVAGLYPLAAPLVSLGVQRWHRESRDTFSTPLEQLGVGGRLVRWSTPAAESPTEPVEPAASGGAPGVVADLTPEEVADSALWPRDALGIPRPSSARLAQLFRKHAPLWELDVQDENDLIGTPVWDSGPAIDPETATQYQLLSHTRFGGEVLLQLNYIIWFRARTGDDIYAGRFDGLTWRVTLGPEARPWLYDSIHNCGCYHSFFPAPPLQLREDLPTVYFERPLLPLHTPLSASTGPLVVRLEHQRHFIQRVYPLNDTNRGRALILRDYNELRALAGPQGHHSFFGPHGLVAGSERPERFILWPMGIRSPGAMRQWGRHAVAFVGRRHFDDPFLIPTLFERVPGS